MAHEPQSHREERPAARGRPGWRVAAVRLGCVAYVSLLTLLLLAPDPWALLGIEWPRAGGQGIGVHFICFAVLGVMIAASRLPYRPWLPGGVLAGYAVAVELLQYYAPPRTVEFRDLLENLLGAATGATVSYVLGRRTSGKRQADDQSSSST